MALSIDKPLVGSKNWGAKLNTALGQVEAVGVAAETSATSAAASAAAVQEDREYVENLVITDLGTTDGQTAALVGTPSSLTAEALNASFLPDAERSTVTLGAALLESLGAVAPTVVWTGMSLPYGQDTTATGTNPPVNGASQNRSSTPPPEQFAQMAALLMNGSGGVTLVNQGHPGDQTDVTLSRWAAGSSGLTEIFWTDTNDAMNYGGAPGGPLTIEESVANLTDLIRRANARGSQAVVLAGAPVSDLAGTFKIRAYTNAHRQVAERMGVPFLDVAELLAPLGSNSLWTDGVHLAPAAYSLVGSRVAALFGRYGVAPRRVAPGTTIRPKHGAHSGGSITARGSATDGNVIRLVSGYSAVIPVDVTAPCVPILRLWSETATGTGAGVISYNLGSASGSVDRTISIPVVTGGASMLRCHPLGVGVDSITITCTSGALEIEGIEFVEPSPRIRSTRRAAVSALTGITVGSPGGPSDATWDCAVDEQNPLSPHGAGAASDAKVDFRVTLAEPASGKLAALGISAASLYSSAFMPRSGYYVIRGSTGALTLRELDQGVATSSAVADVFPAGAWTGIITLALTAAGALNVYVNGVLVTTTTPKWRHFIPTVWANAGTPVTVHACSVRTNDHAA